MRRLSAIMLGRFRGGRAGFAGTAAAQQKEV